MSRPSSRLDEALLASGRELFPGTGCAGLSLRALSAHAAVNAGMFHYHFKSKDNFLRALLQQWYEEMFTGLQLQATHQGPALERLRVTLMAFARFARTHRRMVARLWMDVMAGEPVAQAFVRDNAPRHLGLLAELLRAAQAEGALRVLPPAQGLVFVAGSVVMPIIFLGGVADTAVAPPTTKKTFEAQVMSDRAIAERIDIALAALTVGATEKKARR